MDLSATDTRWPCRTEGAQDPPVRLVATLYRLLRDHVHLGDMEQVLLDIKRHPPTGDIIFSNPHLEGLARAHAMFLLADAVLVAVVDDDPPRYPYEDGDTIVLGPQIFAADDGSVINWRGDNYVRQAD